MSNEIDTTKSAMDLKKRSYVRQTEVPRVTLEEALRVPRAIADNYAKKPTRPLQVAQALDMTPTSGPFRDLCGAAIGYGLTEGGPNAAEISLTDLARRIVSPLVEGDDQAAMREAVLRPGVLREFLTKYDGNPLPSESIAFNVLESMGVPPDATERAHTMILASAQKVGYLTKIKEKTFVDLGGSGAGESSAPAPRINDEGIEAELEEVDAETAPKERTTELKVAKVRNRRVFVSHGKNRRIVDQLKELLVFGEFEPVISVDMETVSKPVPQKVLDDMRSSGAGIIHVSPEMKLLDQAGEEQLVLNPNVLIEIGAAMALYGDRFILLVEEGTTMPSNLQGLYEVRYSGKELDYEGTMKVLKALNSFKEPDSGA